MSIYPSTDDDFKTVLAKSADLANGALRAFCDRHCQSNVYETTSEAMEYSLFLGGGGKRIRSATTILGALISGVPVEDVIRPAIGIEMVHTYTLVIDDIQDGDEVRRGHAATHMKFGFDSAVMAGGRLYGRGVEYCLAGAHGKHGVDSDFVLQCIEDVHQGQTADLLSDGYSDAQRGLEGVRFINDRKTGALFALSLYLGAVQAGEARARELAEFGRELGYVFQASDDILEHTGDEAVLGKPVGKDRGQKLTYWSAFKTPEAAIAHRDARVTELEARTAQLDNGTGFLTHLLHAVAFRSK